MKLLRDILALCVSVVVMLAVASCSGHSDRPGLVALDSLILQDPDSACELLAAYPADSLPTADDRAYHALLTTIADYKAYRPATTDSVINIALNHYDRNGANQNHRMRSLLYKGCVMEELGNPKQAMRFYKEAQYVCPDNDNFHNGYILYRIAGLFQSIEEISLAAEYYRNSIDAFSKDKELYYSLNCITSLGEILRKSDPQKALTYIIKGIELAHKLNDSYHLFLGYSNLAGLHFFRNDYKQTINISQKALQHFTPDMGNRYAFYYACESYICIEELDSAISICNSIPEPFTVIDSVLLLQCRADIAKVQGDAALSYSLQEEADNLDTEKNCSTFNNQLVKIALEIDQIRTDESKQRRLISVIAVLSLIVIVISVVIYIQRKKIELSKREVEVAQYQLSDLRNQIADSLQQISALKQQQEAARPDEQLSTLMGSIDNSLECYSSVLANLLKQMKASGSEKNSKLAAIMNDEFFAQLYRFVNLRHDNLVDRLSAPEFNLTNEEINIICLDLCKFPNVIQWTYSNCDRYHSLHNKKKKIANKVHNSETIADIPQNI